MSDIVVIKADTPAALADQERVVYALPGGGRRIRHYTGRETVIGGEALRHALRGRRIRKPLIPGDPIYNGQELVVDASVLQGWLKRRAEDLGPVWTVVGEEAVPTTLGKSVPEQQCDALNQQIAQNKADGAEGRPCGGYAGPVR